MRCRSLVRYLWNRAPLRQRALHFWWPEIDMLHFCDTYYDGLGDLTLWSKLPVKERSLPSRFPLQFTFVILESLPYGGRDQRFGRPFRRRDRGDCPSCLYLLLPSTFLQLVYLLLSFSCLFPCLYPLTVRLFQVGLLGTPSPLVLLLF